MSSTNKTSNYELSQFLGTDKPAWLADYNSDMSKIDTQMKANADSASGADGKADANATAIGTLASLTTDAKTNVVSAINEVDAHADTAQNTATGASTVANGAKTTADALSAYLSITDTGTISPTISGGTATTTELYYALNTAGTLGKVYGRCRFTVGSAGTITITLPISGLSVESQFAIAGASYYNVLSGGAFTIINSKDVTVNTDHTITMTFSGLNVGDVVTFWLPPCLYFFTDFGDVIGD